MKEEKRTLYECSHARVKGERIYCRKGHPFFPPPGIAHLDIGRLAEGKRLAFKPCQACPDFDFMGPPVDEEDRGWIAKEELA